MKTKNKVAAAPRYGRSSLRGRQGAGAIIRKSLMAILLALTIGTAVHAQNLEKEAKQTPRVLGVGLRAAQFSISELFQVIPPGSVIYISMNPHRNFRIEPEFGYYSSKSYSESLKEDVKDQSFRFGLGIFPMLQRGNTNLYFGVRIANIKVKNEFVVPASAFTYKKEERISKQFLFGPAIGAEYFLGSHFSFGGEVGINHSTLDSDISDEEDIIIKSVLTETNLIVRFYF